MSINKQNTYEIKGGDGGAYGPVFGPVIANEVCEVQSIGKNLILLHLKEPIHYQGEKINFLVVSPRYVGDTLETIRSKGCTVAVGRVFEGQEEMVKKTGVTSSNSEYWSIGICTPMH